MKCNISRIVRLLVFVFVVMVAFLFSPPAFAKDLYVNASTGSDSYTWAQNDAAHPWATFTKGVQTAIAGDTVYVAAGTYTAAGSGGRWTPAFNPANSGTAGNPITFIGGAGVVLRTDMVAGPIIGADGRNYITWKNFIIDEINYVRAPDTCSIVIHVSTGSVIDSIEVIGRNIGNVSGSAENHSAIRIEAATSITVRNSKFHGMTGNAPINHNTGGIMTYGVSNSVFENNEIYATYSGIFLKGTSPGYTINGNIIRYNYFHDLNSDAVILLYGYTNTYVYQNIMEVTGSGVMMDDTTSLAGSSIHNNTIVNVIGSNGSIYAKTITTGPVTVKNNIIYGGSYAVVLQGGYSMPISFNHNGYFGQSISNRWYSGSAQTFAQWQAGVTGGDSHSILTDPLFVNASAHDYHLQDGSPARTASDTGGANGAYISGTETIGTGMTVMPPMQGSTSSGGGGCSITGTKGDSINASSIVYLFFLIAPAILLFVRN